MSSYEIVSRTAESVVSRNPALLFPNDESAKLNVLTLAPFYPFEGDDGFGCFLAEPLRALQKTGIKNTVFVATPFYRSMGPVDSKFVPAARLKYFSLPKGLGLASSGAFLFSSLAERIREWRAQASIDLLHAHGALPCGHAASLLFREFGIPYVVSVHGLDAYSTRQVKGLPGRWCERISRRTYASARRVICVSGHVQQEVGKGGHFSTEVVYNSVDPEIFTPTVDPPDADPVILSVGNLIPSKGQNLLLQAFASLLEQFPRVRCEIVGDGPERESLARRASELGIQDRVSFLGRISRQHVADAMRRCTIFALPSTYEALGCTYLEAMQCGKPVIGCYGQGIEEVIQNGRNGLLIESHNLRDLIGALSRLLADSDLRSGIGTSAHRTVHQHFTLAHQVENLARIYAECAR